MKTNIFLLIGVSTCMLFAMSAPSGRPWNKRAQTIPGRVECEFFDRGGEGISYHDTDSVNNGSGKLNPANGDFLNGFRMKEGVDISYTKSGAVDDHAYNKIDPQMNQLYVGWTQPGEWINYTVKVTETATYRVSTLYTANRDGMIGLSIDGKPAAVHIKIGSTYDERDTVAWRQWHHWNRLDSLAEIKMGKGMHTLTLHIEKEGNMNFDYLEWKKK